MKVLIVAGGSSSERKISLISARAVKEELAAGGHVVTVFDFRKGLTALRRAISGHEVVFPVMHGKEGEDGTLYAFLRATGKPFVGSDPKGAKTAFNKVLFKRYCARTGIPTARWKVVKTADDIGVFGFPCVLKAASGGSSREVALVRREEDASSANVRSILKLQDTLYVEELLEGTEITMSVIGGKALPVIEIVPPKGGWFDYKNKYSGASREIPFAPSVSEAIERRSQRIAVRIHKDLKLGAYSRTDVIVEGGTPYVLEVNTPGGVGLTPESLFPKAGKAAGMPFRELLEKIIGDCVRAAPRRRC